MPIDFDNDEAVFEAMSRSDLTESERDDIALWAELIPFKPEQRAKVCEFLGYYIWQNKFSRDHDKQVLVCAAIRKYTCYFPTEQLDDLVQIIRPGVDVIFELEFAKMIGRRLHWDIEAMKLPLMGLRDAAAELVQKYPPNRLDEQYVGALLMDAFVFLGVMRDERSEMLTVYPQWLKELVADNIKALCDDRRKTVEYRKAEEILQSFRTKHDFTNPVYNTVETAILFSETVAFNEKQQSELLPYLWAYIDTNMQSEEVHVGCAIRRLTAYLPLHNFTQLIPLLKSGNKTIELETIKGLLYRSCWSDIGYARKFGNLNEALFDLVRRDGVDTSVPIKHSISVNAAIVLALWSHPQIIEVVQSMGEAFVHQMSLRAKYVRDLLRKQYGRTECGLVEALC